MGFRCPRSGVPDDQEPFSRAGGLRRRGARQRQRADSRDGRRTATASGLKYWDRKVSTGTAVVKGQIVKVHYPGWLTNGKKFDSSYDAGRPFSLKLGAGQGDQGLG